MKQRRTLQRGQAIVIVITVTAMLFIVGLAFFMLTQAERTSSLRHIDGVRARYVAEAGVAYARMLLAADRRQNLIDSSNDVTTTDLAGNDFDMNADQIPECRWVYLRDGQGNPFGRFAAKITDEAGKVNLNSARAPVLGALFSALGLDRAKAERLVANRPFNAVEQAGSVVGTEDLRRARDYLTTYSRDLEVDLDRKRRTLLNTASSQALQEVCLASGISNAAQKAANIKDASDEDLAQTITDTFVATNIIPSVLTEAGGWQGSGAYYEAQAGGAVGKFSWNNLALEDGEYYCYLYGSGDGDVVGQIDSQTVHTGEALVKKVKIKNGSLTLEIAPAADTVCRFSHIELAGTDSKLGLTRKVIAGTEALVINELMVRPARDVVVASVDIPQGQGVHQTLGGIKAGVYHVSVLAASPAGLVGDVTIHGQTMSLMHSGDYFTHTVSVDTSQNLTIDIKNNTLQPASFRGVRLSQEPDAEYIEVLNLSDRPIDMSGFSLSAYNAGGEMIAGWPAKIPPGAVIGPFAYLVFSVDSNDAAPAPGKLCSNNISFRGIWGFGSVGLNFEEFGGTIDKTFDLLPNGSGTVVLGDAQGRRVDAVEYQSMQVNDFVALERSDPTACIDSDADGFFDGWYASTNQPGATPGVVNENMGMYTADTQSFEQVLHSPAECVVYNHSLTGLAQVTPLASGQRWKRIPLRDVSKMADHLATDAVELSLAGHFIDGDFVEVGGAFSSDRLGQTGTWEFADIHTGSYLLSIASDSHQAKDGHLIQVSYKINDDGEFSNPASMLFSCGIALFGRVEISGVNPCRLQLKVTNSSRDTVVIKSVRLEPVYATSGRININTASEQVLGSVIPDEILVRTILQKRPLGAGTEKLGTGELFLINPGYLNYYNDLTVKSDIYEITSHGEYAPRQRAEAFATVRTIVERTE